MVVRLNKIKRVGAVGRLIACSMGALAILTGGVDAQKKADLPPGVTRRPARVVAPPQKAELPPAPATPTKASEPIVEPTAASPTGGPAGTPAPGVETPRNQPEPQKTKPRASLPPGVTPRPDSSVVDPPDTVDVAGDAVKAAAAMKKAEGGVNDGMIRPGSEPQQGGGLEGSLIVRPDARTMTLSVPAPRGQITDRHGKPFAQSKVIWYPALKFGQFEKADRDYVITWARKRIAQANKLFGIDWKVTDERLWQHYRNRRWLAMPVTHVVHEDRKNKLEKSLMSGLILHPGYMRFYPQNEAAAHIIGYVGSAGKLEKGPINYGDPIFQFSEGRSGLEKLFDQVLKGKPGLLRKDYEADGTEVVKMFERRPKPGGTVVTTLDLDWQNYAEVVLKKYCSRGAFVVIDIQTGEVMTMASRPSFDLNDFLPYITTAKYKALREDPGTPLFGRAFQGGYPPASTFKPVVALAALNNRDVGVRTLINCPAAIRIGKHWFRNWTKIPEGDINVKRALARSCNTWFYQVGIMTGPSNFLSVARRLGFGSKTGLPLIGETSGLIPTSDWMKKHHGRRMMDGDTANLSIGQGVMLASPLQVAQAMAGIANGGILPKLWLVKQIQDVGGRVLVSNEPKRRNYLNLDPVAVDAVREGMMQVVNEGYGTGQRGGLSYTILCGKTGTAQWGPKSKEKRLAWFAGFFPYKNPRFAFAALYEGKPFEKLSGGRKAAPMVSSFFEHFKKDIKIIIKPQPKAMVVEEDEEENAILDVEDAPRAVPVEENDGGFLLDPGMETPGAGNSQGGFIPSNNQVRPLTPTPPPSRAVPVEEDAVPPARRSPPISPLQPFNPPSRTPERSNRAVPVEE